MTFNTSLKNKLKNKHATAILLSLSALGFITLLGLIFPRYFEEWEEKTVDYRFRFRKYIYTVPRYQKISNIGIDDGSLDRLGVWPWDRSIHARMIELLTSLDVAGINMDIFFPRRSGEPGDSQLIDTIRTADNVILSAPFELIDHPCFTQKEYAIFLKNYPHAKDIISSLISHKDESTCIDFNALSNEQWNALGQEAGLELMYHDEFVFTGEEDQEKFELFSQRFDYPFTIDHQEQLWYANRALLPLKELLQVASGLGHVSATPDSDGVFRRVPLVIRVKNRLIPHLALASVLRYLQVKPQDVTIVPGKYLLLRNAQFPETTTLKDIKIPIDKRLRLRVNYPLSQKSHSFADILEAEEQSEWNDFWKKELQGHICTIGYVVTGTGDIGPNPIETNFPLAFIHAAIMNTILTENFLYDTGWKTNISIGLILVLLLAFIAPRLSPLRFTLAGVFLISGYIFITIVLFTTYGIILKLLNPVLTVLIAYTLITGYKYATEERERKYLRSAFKIYVSKQVLTKILENPKSLSLQGQRKELSMLFSDIRAFSTLSDNIDPERIHRLLNLYFSRMTNIVFRYDGIVDKFIGDGLFCFFGDPIHPDHALRAVRSAVEMQQEVRALAPQIREELELDPIRIRIGINTGYVIVGNMGSSERLEYTVLGSNVNLAQRLEASARPGQIWISERTYHEIQGKIEARKLDKTKIKGLKDPVQPYEIILPFE